MAVISDGIYKIEFTPEQQLTALEPRPGGHLCLLPPDSGYGQTWQVSSDGNGSHTIRATDSELYVSFDGDPDMHELALVLPEARPWRLAPAAEPDTFVISVPATPMRLGLSLLRIFPPRVALAPDFGDPYQAWTFIKTG
ncbi:hypothetical protein ACWDLG_24420 [Nonomuraea sp. NPDC003727]|uniref:hypothetical protein n=1 Tax=Nonomuraea sp. NPDC003804 TaxID=3154547 RepID=UPI0033A4505F